MKLIYAGAVRAILRAFTAAIGLSHVNELTDAPRAINLDPNQGH